MVIVQTGRVAARRAGSDNSDLVDGGGDPVRSHVVRKDDEEREKDRDMLSERSSNVSIRLSTLAYTHVTHGRRCRVGSG